MKKSGNQVSKKRAIALYNTGVAVMPTPAEFFPSYTLVGVEDWNELHVLGHNNVRYLLAQARRMEKERTDKIDRLQNRKGVFETALKFPKTGHFLTVADFFEELSHQYDNPQFLPGEIGECEGNWSHEPEPLTEESKTRRAGTTNFNICGWCGHCGGGVCRYDCHISTTCGLLDTYPEQIYFEEVRDYSSASEGGPHVSHESKFNTPCLLKHLISDQCQGVLDSIMFCIDMQLIKREEVRMVINKLLEQCRLTKKIGKPWIVNNRPCEYMNVGDPMVVYIGGWGSDKLVQGDWVNAIGVFGYRHQDGCLSYQAEFPIHTNASYYEGRGGGAGMSRPEAMLATEFATLTSMVKTLGPDATYAGMMGSKGIENPNEAFLRIWFKNIMRRKIEGFDCTKFFNALKDHNFAIPPEGWTPPVEEIKVETVKDAECVLQCLDWKFFDTEDEIKGWATMQLQFVHPDKHQKSTPEVQAYAARQTKAVIAARNLLIKLFHEQNG